MLRRNRVYRVLRVAMTIAAAVMRYLWLMARDKLRLFRPRRGVVEQGAPQDGSRHLSPCDRARRRVRQARPGARRAGPTCFPAAFVEPLQGLHDRVPSRPFRKLRKHVERELGRSIEDAFESVSEEAIAAASLAQVHRARTAAGDDVVIKVQYPEARKLFPTDLGSLRRATRVLRFFNRKLDLRVLADELAEFVCLELDFGREAVSTDRIRGAFGDDDRVRIPVVHHDLSTARVLVLEYLEGERITDMEAWAEIAEPRTIAERVASIYSSMIFDHGFLPRRPPPGQPASHSQRQRRSARLRPRQGAARGIRAGRRSHDRARHVR